MATTATPSTADASQLSADRGADQLLVWAVTFFAVAVLIHNSDHLRRGFDSVGGDVFVAGSSAILLEIAIVVLGCQRHRWAPVAAMVTGFSLAAGYLAVHFLPPRRWLSDSFTGATDVSPLSWGAASLETLAATALGVAGLIALSRRGGLASAARPNPGQRPLRDVATHPVVVVTTLGNALIFAISITQI